VRLPHVPRLRSSRPTARSAALRGVLLATMTIVGVAAAGAGMLGPGDAQLGSGEYYDRVVFDGVAGDEVLIELASTAFDAYLVVLDPNERVLYEEDDTPGLGLDVRATVRLPVSGRYTVVVTSARALETGPYRLTIAGSGAAAAVGTTVPGTSTAVIPPPGPTPLEPRTVIGTVVDTAGRPIAGARVWIQPAVTTGLVEVRTGPDGRYRASSLIDVPYTAKAWAQVEYGGRLLCLRLGMSAPADYDAFVPTHGAVRDFRWQLTGPIEDLRSLNEYFGGMLRVMNAAAHTVAGARVELTFTPTGPRIDGSDVAPFTRSLEAGRGSDIYDLPVGPYRVTAALVMPDGVSRPLRLGPDGFDTGRDALDVDWTGDGTCSNTSGVGWAYAWLEPPG
jgi:hypothetical protein